MAMQSGKILSCVLHYYIIIIIIIIIIEISLGRWK
jgi:hypothetical protein